MKKVLANPFLFFLPFLIMYAIMILVLRKNVLEGDEGRYLLYANNLVQGFYSPKGQVYLWNGPGYPILLMPFVALHFSLLSLTLFNAVFQYLSVVLIYKTLLIYISKRKALFFSIFWACYYIAFKEMGLIYTESFTILLISAFQYFFIRAFKVENPRKYCIAAGLLLGYIILTKVIFAYVVLALMFTTIILLFSSPKKHTRKIIFILVLAIGSNLPYLFYTYQLSGKFFYWANSGGSSLYWASSPFAGEFGDWNNEEFTTYCNIDSLIPCNSAIIAKNHEADFTKFRQYDWVQKDMAFKAKAIENIKAHPAKYLKNYVCNAGRMVFGVPQSFFYQRFENLLRIPPNAIVFTFLLFSSIITLLYRHRIKYEIRFLALFLVIYLAGSAALSAEQRQFYIVIPMILLWTAFIFNEFVTLHTRSIGRIDTKSGT